MKYRMNEKSERWGVLAVAFVLCLLEMLMFAGIGTKGIVLCFVLVAVALLLLKDVKPLWNISTLLLMGYVIFAGLGAIWAMSGKFFLREYSKLMLALPIFLYVMLKPVVDRGFARRVMQVFASASALVAFCSVEMVTTGLFSVVLNKGLQLDSLSFGYSDRLYGIFGNSNVEASVYALGILAALACIEEAKDRKGRIFNVVLCSLSAFAFLLCISVGATICLAVAVVVYLIAAGKARVKVLLRMLFVAVPTVVFVVISTAFFGQNGVIHVIPLLLMAISAGVSSVLEVYCMEKFSHVMERHTKIPVVTMLALVALVVIYLVAAVNLTSAYTFSLEGERLSRADYTAAGTHTLTIEADGPVRVWITSQTRYDILQGNYPTIYDDTVEQDVTYSVPENTAVCNYWFYAEPGTKITSATIDGITSIPLKYTILPAFVADRLQGAWTSSSLVIRQALWDYGMRLFRLSPVVGNGYGAYECGIVRVEDFRFETKYVHNHYIQVLLESGIIGFALYISALLSMAVVLLKKRHAAEDEEFGWCYPALAAAFVMICTVTLWDISMSRALYLMMAYALFALLIRLFAAPLPVKEKDTKALSKKELAAEVQRANTRNSAVRILCALFPALFALTLVGNMVAQNKLAQQVSSYSEYFANAKFAAELDPYEYNDAKLSYIMVVARQQEEEYLDQANQFANELMQVQSNSLPYYLEQYYISTKQYEKALEAAKMSTIYSAADPDTWNASFNQLWKGIVLNEEALASDMDTLFPLLLEYRDAFDQRNATAIQPITLSDSAQSCYDMLGEMEKMDQESRAKAEDYLNFIIQDYHKVMGEYLESQENAGD